jgi:uncharacterized protein (TIGR02217 family)
VPAFHDTTFPEDISRGCTGGPMYQTDILTSRSGHEVRLPTWSYARRQWAVTLESWDEARLNTIIAFFHARFGKAYAFRFKDWSDYYAGMTMVAGTGLTYNPAATSETLGTGDGSAAAFQLIKAYTSGGYTTTRRITRPRSTTIKIYVAGTLKTETTHYTINYSTGVVTFTGGNIPTAGQAIKWAGQFDIPARFDTDQMSLNLEAIMCGEWPSINIVEIRE